MTGTMRATVGEWWAGISLRAKITGVTVLVLTLGLVVSGLGTMTLIHTYLIRDANTQISQTLRGLTVASTENNEAASATQFVFAHFTEDGELIQANPTWQRADPQIGRITAADVRDFATPSTVKQGNVAAFQIAARQLTDGSIVVLGIPLESINRLIAQLFTLFFVFGIGVVIVGGVVTRLLVGSTFAPLKQVERTAAAIADGDFGQRLGHTTPNTEVGRLNRSLNRMLNRIDGALADRARTIDQMRRFVGDASHELRTPLVSVRGYAELYRMGALQSREDVAQAMDRIEREAIRLGALVSDLLALARLDESRELKRTVVELLPIAHDAALDARAFAPSRPIRVIGHDPEQPTGTVEILRPVTDEASDETPATTTSTRLFRRGVTADAASVTGSLRLASARLLRARRRARDGGVDDAPAPLMTGTARPVVLAEEDKLRQVLANLIGNAIRFTPDGTPIEIATYGDKERGLAMLEIIDHGDGIPPQVRDKIFQRFWRADSSRTRDTGGSGLGLAIVAAIVSAHQGTIGISETAGGGATFRVALPLLPSDENDREADRDDVDDEEREPAS
ncbi:two-component system OmpR family sensor kinase [Amnibacterium kyonggiense]|uniref:histidine kinase n=2 Tax=Amnibacterium kyonggiense TaxID=595671 RepID=A0A4R7FRQ4_9MICO|nr:two-component system OmpR family sensor kinase [Amnibacterium kyonggiense]